MGRQLSTNLLDRRVTLRLLRARHLLVSWLPSALRACNCCFPQHFVQNSPSVQRCRINLRTSHTADRWTAPEEADNRLEIKSYHSVIYWCWYSSAVTDDDDAAAVNLSTLKSRTKFDTWPFLLQSDLHSGIRGYSESSRSHLSKVYFLPVLLMLLSWASSVIASNDK